MSRELHAENRPFKRFARAILLAWGLSLIFSPAQSNSPGTIDQADRSDEPFGLSTATVSQGAVLEEWLNVEREVDDERLVLRMCEENRASCQSPTALQFLAIVNGGRVLGGRARIGEINRAINLKLKPVSDLALHGAEDVWSPPLATFATGAGDCEDYAIAKFVALQEAGISADDLRIVILRDDFREEDHAVVAARLDGHWLTLDNRHMVWSRTMTCGVTALYFWSTVTASKLTPMCHLLSKHRADTSAP
jgi:predicted transglutaminase-like cysteine proteinase